MIAECQIGDDSQKRMQILQQYIKRSIILAQKASSGVLSDLVDAATKLIDESGFVVDAFEEFSDVQDKELTLAMDLLHCNSIFLSQLLDRVDIKLQKVLKHTNDPTLYDELLSDFEECFEADIKPKKCEKPTV